MAALGLAVVGLGFFLAIAVVGWRPLLLGGGHWSQVGGHWAPCGSRAQGFAEASHAEWGSPLSPEGRLPGDPLFLGWVMV